MRILCFFVLCSALGCKTQKVVEQNESIESINEIELGQSEDVANSAWAKRENKEALAKAIEAWTRITEEKESAELLVKIARARFLYADAFLFEDDVQTRVARQEMLLAGSEAAFAALKITSPELIDLEASGASHKESLLKLTPDSIGALYWYSVNLARWARADGPLRMMRHKGDIRLNLERIRRLDPTFFYGAPERFFGALEAATIGLLGGSLERSNAAFERAIAIAPEYLGNKVVYAKLGAVAKKDRALFERLLQEVLSADPTICEGCAPENFLEQQKAKRLLARIEKLF